MHYLASVSSPSIFDSLDIAESTRQDYTARLPKFIGFLRNEGIHYDTLLNYKKYLRSRHDLGIASKNKYLAVARITLKELYRQGKISVDLSLNVKAFQQTRKHRVQGLTEDEVKKICLHLQALDDSLATVRLRALVALLLFQGLRQAEICTLDVADIELANKQLQVLGKGRDDKEYIHLHPQTVKALTAYLKQSRVKDGPLFTPLLLQGRGQRLTTRGLRLIIQRLFYQLGIEKTVHGFRHYFTTQLLKEYKGELTTVARFTRHKSLEMLQVYDDSLIEAKSITSFHALFSKSLLQ